MYEWITEDRPFVVVGMGRSGTTFLTRTIAHARNHGYAKEITGNPGFMGETDVDLLRYLRDYATTHTTDGKLRAHKMVTQQFRNHYLYLPFVKFFEARGVQWVFSHRNLVDILRSDLVVQQTNQWQLLGTDDPTSIDWPTELIPDVHTVRVVAQSYHRLMLFRSMIDPANRVDVHYSVIPELAATVGYDSPSIPMTSHYPAWDETVAGRMLLDRLVETHDDVWSSVAEGT